MASVLGSHIEESHEFGYKTELHRSLGTFESFAAGFSFVSILTTIFQLFGLGFGFAGPAFFFTWIIVYIGQFFVALNFAELSVHYPIAGAIYHWSGKIGGEIVGWFAGWTMIIAQIVTASTASIALQVVMPNIWSGFQLIGTNSDLSSVSGSENAVIWGTLLLILTTSINAIGVRWMSTITAIGVICEIVGVLVVVLVLFIFARRSPDVVFSQGVHANQNGYIYAFLASSIMAGYVMVGFGSAGELAEETKNPRRVAPRTIRMALSVSAIGGALIIIGALVASPSLTNGLLASQGLPYVLNSVLGGFWSKILLADVAIAVFVCTLAIQTAATRLMFGMARDNRLPGAKYLSKVNSRTKIPLSSALIVGFAAIAVLLINLGNSALFTTLSSVCICLIYLAYLGVTVPLLIARFKGWPHGKVFRDANGKPYFRLGKFGLIANIIAVVYGISMIINMAWPRAEIYNPNGTNLVLQWAGPISIILVVGVGFLVSIFAPKPIFPILKRKANI